MIVKNRGKGLTLTASLVVAIMVWWEMVRGVPKIEGLVVQAAAVLGVICPYLMVECNKRPHQPASETANA